MAKLLCQVHWDGKEVVTTYQVLQIEPKDKIEVTTTDSEPFIIQTKNARLAKTLGLRKVTNADGRTDLYQVQKAAPAQRAALRPPKASPRTTLKYGTLAAQPGGWNAWVSPAALRPPKASPRTTLKYGTLDKQGHFVERGAGGGGGGGASLLPGDSEGEERT
jgi:hypothetical protein